MHSPVPDIYLFTEATLLLNKIGKWTF